jgi:hypothetical protein
MDTITQTQTAEGKIDYDELPSEKQLWYLVFAAREGAVFPGSEWLREGSQGSRANDSRRLRLHVSFGRAAVRQHARRASQGERDHGGSRMRTMTSDLAERRSPFWQGPGVPTLRAGAPAPRCVAIPPRALNVRSPTALGRCQAQDRAFLRCWARSTV